MVQRGVFLTTEQFAPSDLIDVARKIEALGYESLWIPELFGREPFVTAGMLLGRTERVQVATGIANVYARDAHALAQARSTLAELSGGRFVLGLGVSNAAVNQLRGHAWQAPLAKMTSTLDALATQAAAAAATAHSALIHIAAHGPLLQRLGATRTAGVITFLMPPEHTQASRARIGSTAALSVVAPFIAERDATTARAKARAALNVYMPLDYYRREWRKLGFTDADYADGGSDRLVDTLVAWGDETQLNDRIAAHQRAGATRVVVLPLALTSRTGLDLRVLEMLAHGQGITS